MNTYSNAAPQLVVMSNIDSSQLGQCSKQIILNDWTLSWGCFWLPLQGLVHKSALHYAASASESPDLPFTLTGITGVPMSSDMLVIMGTGTDRIVFGITHVLFAVPPLLKGAGLCCMRYMRFHRHLRCSKVDCCKQHD